MVCDPRGGASSVACFIPSLSAGRVLAAFSEMIGKGFMVEMGLRDEGTKRKEVARGPEVW